MNFGPLRDTIYLSNSTLLFSLTNISADVSIRVSKKRLVTYIAHSLQRICVAPTAYETATHGRSLMRGKISAAPLAPVPTSASVQKRKYLRHFVLFLLGTDLVVLFIYLLLVPSNVWEGLETRLHSIGALVKSVGIVAGSLIGYFGLKSSLRRYLLSLDTVFDQLSFAAMVGLGTLILWGAVLPIWKVELRFSPPQPMPPRVELLSKARPLIERRDNQTTETTYVLEGLLLRPYELKVEGAREPVNIPLITVLKGTMFRRFLFVQLPCTLEISPIVPEAEVWLKRVGAEKPDDWGAFPDDGRLSVVPGSYEYIRVTNGKREVRQKLVMVCPTTNIEIPW